MAYIKKGITCEIFLLISTVNLGISMLKHETIDTAPDYSIVHKNGTKCGEEQKTVLTPVHIIVASAFGKMWLFCF